MKLCWYQKLKVGDYLLDLLPYDDGEIMIPQDRVCYVIGFEKGNTIKVKYLTPLPGTTEPLKSILYLENFEDDQVVPIKKNVTTGQLQMLINFLGVRP